MRRPFAVFVFALLALGTALSCASFASAAGPAATTTMACLDAFVTSTLEPCVSLRDFDACVAGIAADDDQRPRALRALNAAKLKLHDCPYIEIDQTASADSEGLHFYARRDVRFRREEEALSIWELEARVATMKYRASMLASSAELARVQARLADAISNNNLTDTAVGALASSIRMVANGDAVADLHDEITEVARQLHASSLSQEQLEETINALFHEETRDLFTDVETRTHLLNRKSDSILARFDEIAAGETAVEDDYIAEGEAHLTSLSDWIVDFISRANSRLTVVDGQVEELQSRRAAIAEGISAINGYLSGTVNNLPAVRTKQFIYSGWCNQHGRNGGWNSYCLSNTDFFNAQAYFAVINQSNGEIRVLQSGYARIHMFAISHVCNVAHIRLIVNGATRHYGHENAFNTWTDNFMDVTWRFSAGDTFYVTFYNSGCSSYAYHHGPTYSRLQVFWEGSNPPGNVAPPPL